MRLKITSLPVHLSLSLIVLALVGCGDKCQIKNTYTYYAPVYSTSAEIKAAVAQKPAQTIKNLGKLYFKDGILFVNERGEGIHIIDNHDPSNPQPLSFLKIPGNTDLAIKGNTLYADSFIDLVSFDISDIGNIKEVARNEGLFTIYNSFGFNYEPGKGIITSWEKREEVSVEHNDCEGGIQPWGGIYYDDGIALNSYAASSPMTVRQSTGMGGSMASFTIVNNHLYVVDGSNLDVIDISTASQPVPGVSVSINWDIQTLFPFNNKLFVGARAGMYIYDLAAPEQPTLISQYDHMSSCDPVVIEGDIAYVTLYDGDICHMGTNQLEVIDIKELTAPSLMKTYPMTNPHGLGISNGILFICDGQDGLKIFDATNPLTISDHLLAHYADIDALDVIPFGNTAMMIGSDGIYQYDYSDVHDIKLLSQIPILKP